MVTIQDLKDLKSELAVTPATDREAFCGVFAKAMTLLTREDAICEEFDASQASVGRWKAGESAPVVAVRRFVLRSIIEYTMRLIEGENDG